MNLTALRAALLDRNIQEVARQTGIHPFSLYRLRNGITARPSRHMVEALAKYLGVKDNGKSI